ncbi:tetratricopeptide repeat protein [Marivita sp. XM-24bin2]|uniref:tetratricopeptide repeat protein n=1 Tax=unclassified Marivita TaxID=2632480 RepID=UPI0025BA461A|nr:tetratricopeptide repeat protein [Marivita sp. XM-24bin2]MCR9110071.1 tetratricopeptide repeat protein [Paracoccaceae bacterium]
MVSPASVRSEFQAQLKSLLGEAHPDVGASYNNLASCLHEQGNVLDAERFYQTSLAILQAALGETHPNVWDGYNNLADCLQGQGRDREAIEI